MTLLDVPDDESSYLFDLSNLHELSELSVTFHAMRFPIKPFVRMLSSVALARSQLRCLALSLFTWRFWSFKDQDVDRWEAVDITLAELSQAVRERSGVDLAIRVIVNLLEYGPHDIRDILPRSGNRGLVRLVCDGDSTSDLS